MAAHMDQEPSVTGLPVPERRSRSRAFTGNALHGVTCVLSVRLSLQGIFNDDTFSKMKRGARVINVARGGVIDEPALVRALDAGIVAQARISPPPYALCTAHILPYSLPFKSDLFLLFISTAEHNIVRERRFTALPLYFLVEQQAPVMAGGAMLTGGV